MSSHGTRQLRMSSLAQPSRPRLAVAQLAQRMCLRQGLVQVMEERGCDDESSVDRDADL